MSLEKTSQSKPVGSEHLFDMKGRVDEMHSKDVETIVIEACARSRDQQFKRKVTALNLRASIHGEQDKTAQTKVDERLKLHGLFLDCASIVFAVGQAVAGQTIVGGLMGVAHQAFSKASDQKEKSVQATIFSLDHRYDRQKSISGDHGQQIQMTDNEWEKTAQAIERMEQARQRTAEIIVSSGG